MGTYNNRKEKKPAFLVGLDRMALGARRSRFPRKTAIFHFFIIYIIEKGEARSAIGEIYKEKNDDRIFGTNQLVYTLLWFIGSGINITLVNGGDSEDRT